MNVVVDTREKEPWTFSQSDTIVTVAKSLKTGDYAIENMEYKLCIERKKSCRPC